MKSNALFLVTGMLAFCYSNAQLTGPQYIGVPLAIPLPFEIPSSFRPVNALVIQEKKAPYNPRIGRPAYQDFRIKSEGSDAYEFIIPVNPRIPALGNVNKQS